MMEDHNEPAPMPDQPAGVEIGPDDDNITLDGGSETSEAAQPVADPRNIRYVVAALVVVVVVTVALALASANPLGQLVVVFCYLPAGALLYWVQRCHRQVIAPTDALMRFGSGLLVMFPFVVISSFVVIMICMFILSQVADIADTKIGLSKFLSVLATVSVVLAVVVSEESQKYLATFRVFSYGTLPNPKQYVFVSLLVACGIATGESLFVAFLTTDGDSFGDDFVTVAICCVFLIPMHLLSAYHIGLGVARKTVLKQDVAALSVVAQPVAVRGVYTYFLLFGKFLFGVDHEGIGALLALIIIPVYIVVVKRAEAMMPADYLARTGYIGAFGYGVVGTMDVASEGGTPQDQPIDVPVAEPAPTNQHN